jgi:hypothetical protein
MKNLVLIILLSFSHSFKSYQVNDNQGNKVEVSIEELFKKSFEVSLVSSNENLPRIIRFNDNTLGFGKVLVKKDTNNFEVFFDSTEKYRLNLVRKKILSSLDGSLLFSKKEKSRNTIVWGNDSIEEYQVTYSLNQKSLIIYMDDIEDEALLGLIVMERIMFARDMISAL